MTGQEALRVAIRVVTKEWREIKRNVMADPRAAELRQQKLDELAETLTALGVVPFCG